MRTLKTSDDFRNRCRPHAEANTCHVELNMLETSLKLAGILVGSHEND